MNSKNIIVLIAVVAVILIGSIILGTAVGTSDVQTLSGFFLIAIALGAFLATGRNVWILIPLFSAWDGRISLLPLPFSVSNVAVGFAVACWLLLWTTRRVHWRFKIRPFDAWLVAMLVLLGVGYLRNPVGVAAVANNSNVGARPYFEVAVACVGYVILASQRANSSILGKLPIGVICTSIVIAIGGAIAYLMPMVGIVLYQFYSGFRPYMVEVLGGSTAVSTSIGRAEFLLPFALSLGAWLFASRPPITNCSPLRPVRVSLLGISGIATLVSGFRIAVGTLGMYFIIGSFLWWRGKGLILCAVIGVLFIAGVIAVQATVGLPERMQRPLTFLPGDWDEGVKRSADETLQWRLDMWEEVMEGDHIQNWWIGDGFGFPASELAYYGALQKSGNILPQQLANYYLMTGDLHSGPLSAAKFVGVIGFTVFFGYSLTIAWRYARLFRITDDRRLKTVVGFFAIPAIFFPIKFVFIYGAFQNDLPAVIIMAGMLRLLEESLAPESVKVEKDSPRAVLAGDQVQKQLGPRVPSPS